MELPPGLEGTYETASVKAALTFTVVLFALSTAAGFAASPRVAEGISGELAQALAPLLRQGPLILILLIFLNNAIKSLMAILLGFLLGLPPALLVVVNGFLLGVVTRQAAGEVGYAAVLASLIPHGVLEIPAVLLSSAMGFRVGSQVLLFLVARRGRPLLRLRESLRVFLRWVVPALLAAAVVEVFVTPLVQSLFFAL